MVIITIVSSIAVVESDTLTIESGPLSSEDKPLSCQTEFGKEQGISFSHILVLHLLGSSGLSPVRLNVINERQGIVVGSEF